MTTRLGFAIETVNSYASMGSPTNLVGPMLRGFPRMHNSKCDAVLSREPCSHGSPQK